ncbi:glutamate/tyrosine decarboxylase-like PLP-dependent enzyme [Pseudoduganella flava]|uniref:Aminotransferase class V-fold PLP-dependent enzyme n=1 Tax=Pseudoduganella flava TaxID=871742 RepID=A0A562PZG4_9BURK|nr:aminotransferase class V-fold PLP-dependent enzyme [Pseudoduganella flava]QGZ38592.1 aminotransferase class V-fold PLP-dependent enzyme [Pseudoduganella flava]TWI49841.1 glutamate/tyrosine decarboxylase-like PLP-dependent enzyme [Pseudoduganella flava]
MAERTPSLDPTDWNALRSQGHRMLDDMFDYLERLRDRPVWQQAPADVRAKFQTPLPRTGSDLAGLHDTFMRDVLPYAVGNAHPAFFGWVHGGGTPVGMLAEMLAAGLNANVGGRDQIPVEVERQIARWMAELFGFPAGASGLFVTGTSMANMIAVLVARHRALGSQVRDAGLAQLGQGLVAYTSAAAHDCIAQAMDLTGIGRAALRLIPLDAAYRMDTQALEQRIAADVAAGLRPFFVAATAGTVDTGAIDPLRAVAAIAHANGLWFHVDGAFGAMAMLSPGLAPLLDGIGLADSIAFDFHKWAQVPYDAGFVLVRDGELHRATFAAVPRYLRREPRGMAGGSPWPCDFGPDLSRGFRALKTWFTLQAYGADRMGEAIAGTCALARHLAHEVGKRADLELLAPVALNIVCFRYHLRGRNMDDGDVDDFNAALVADLQEAGIAAPSLTTITGKLAIRVAIVNHRSERRDIDALLTGLQMLAARRLGG